MEAFPGVQVSGNGRTKTIAREVSGKVGSGYSWERDAAEFTDDAVGVGYERERTQG